MLLKLVERRIPNIFTDTAAGRCRVRSAEGGQHQSAANIFLEYKHILPYRVQITLHTLVQVTTTSTRITVPSRITVYIIYKHSNDEQPLLDNMGSSQEPPLDEIQWRSPQIAQSMTGIQTNTGREPHVGKACPNTG